MSTFLLDPLGFRFDGRPFWGFSGGDGEDGGDGGDSDGGDDGDGGATETDPVKRLESTLTKVRTEHKATRDEYRPVKAVLRELGIDSPEALREALTKGAGAKGGDTGQQQVDLEKERETVRAQVRQEANREIALAKVESAAKGMFADPDDAVNALKGSVDDLLGRDGKPDAKAIKAELDDLLTRKPHWGIKQQGEIGFDGGARQPGGGKVGMDEFLRNESRRKQGR